MSKIRGKTVIIGTLKIDMSKIRENGYVKDPWQTVGRKSEIEKKYKKIKQRFLPMVKLCH